MAIIDDARTAVRGELCNVLNGLEAIDRFGVNLGLPEDAPPSFPGTPFGNIVNNAQGLFCDRMPEPFPPTFTGGQCLGTIYSYTVSGRSTIGDDRTFTNVLEVRGPLGAISKQADPEAAGRSDFVMSATNSQGQPITHKIISGPTDQVALFSFELVPPTQGPNDCGNRVPIPLPEADRTRPVTINNITGVVAFAFPILNVNGNLQVGFNLNVGELKLSGTAELNTGDINFNFGGQPTDPDAPTVPTPDGTPPDAELDDPEEEKKANIIGVVVVSTPIGNYAGTEVPKDFMPDLFIPRIADVSFQIRIKNRSHWTSDLPVKSRNAYIPCPGEIDAIDVVVEPQDGWAISATPVRGIVPSNQVVLV